jgi:hypothetical protein
MWSVLAASARAQDVETPLEVRLEGEKVVFRVVSHGCTQKEDFVVRKDSHSPYGERGVILTLLRLRPDECRGFFRDGTEVAFSRQELGLPSEIRVRVTGTEDGTCPRKR